MKRFSIISIALIITMVMCLMACTPVSNETQTPEAPKSSTEISTETASTPAPDSAPISDSLWANATYQEDKEFGEGSKTITVLVQAGEKNVKFTIKTDAEYLGAALTENNLVEGSVGEYGLMVEKVNGIQAVYSTDNAYWALYSRGEYSMTGADKTPIADGDQYEWVYTKA